MFFVEEEVRVKIIGGEMVRATTTIALVLKMSNSANIAETMPTQSKIRR